LRVESSRFTRVVLGTGAAATLMVTGLGVPVQSALGAKPRPPVSVHAIFDNGAGAPFRVGQIVQVLAVPGKNSPGKITKVCFSPAPISRPACGRFGEGAPSAVGTTKITVSFSKRSPYVLQVKVLPAATKVGGDQGGLAVPATVTCPSVSLYGSVAGVNGKKEKPMATLPMGTKVALYNEIAPGAITMIDYATGTVGFGEQKCATPGI
jgi:hypothetical protein